MSLIGRIKRLWELSGTPTTYGVTVQTKMTAEDAMALMSAPGPVQVRPVESEPELTFEPVSPVKRLATIVADDPLDIFPSEDPEHEGELE